jgi:addiction module HigA family antidote
VIAEASTAYASGVSVFAGTTAMRMTSKLWTITDMKTLPNIHPGEVLLEEFLLPMDISQNAVARAAGVPPRRINEIVLGKRGISADTAVRLARVFGTSERFWLGLQTDYDLEEAKRVLGRDLLNIGRLAA